MVSREGAQIAVLLPEKRLYAQPSQPMTEAGIDGRLHRDLYVSLGDKIGEEAWAMRLHYKPLVRWIWLGGLMMAVGGLLAASDRRYRRPLPYPATAPTATQASHLESQLPAAGESAA